MKSRLPGIKSGAISRGFALAKVSVSASAKAAAHALGGLFSAPSSEDEKDSRFKALLASQLELLSRELGQLKGSLMKAGQMLSMYGEHLFPPEVNAVLKNLQSQSPPLEWSAIHRVLRQELGDEKLALIEIDPEPYAAASLGQVHRATRKSDGRKFALKIQYPGVDKAIDSDIRALRSLLSVSKLIPSGPKYESVFQEVREMLHQEVDYAKELEATEFFRSWIGSDPRYAVPEPIREFSTSKVLMTSFEDGVGLDSLECLSLPQERRNAIGLQAIELYYREIFELGFVQTDPHFGNYRLRLSDGSGPDQLVLFDFGAVRRFSKEFLYHYREMIRGSLHGDRRAIESGAIGVGFLNASDTEEMKQVFEKLCVLVTEPLQIPPFSVPQQFGVSPAPPGLFDESGAYDFAKSDLPTRLMKAGTELAMRFKLRPPPREMVFLDRKMGGMFIFLSVLKAKLKLREVLDPYLTPSE